MNEYTAKKKWKRKKRAYDKNPLNSTADITALATGLTFAYTYTCSYSRLQVL